MNRTIRFDPGHYCKIFLKNFNKWAKSYKNVEYYDVENDEFVLLKKPFDKLGDILECWLKFVVKIKDLAIRKEQWLNCLDHFLGDTSKDIFKSDKNYYLWENGLRFPRLQEIFYDFLEDQWVFIRQVAAESSTQMVESWNSVI